MHLIIMFLVTAIAGIYYSIDIFRDNTIINEKVIIASGVLFMLSIFTFVMMLGFLILES